MTTALILGAGIIGLSTALELASRGVDVTVLERGEPMAEASWAAAGMLAALDPENPPELTALARLSLELYPDFLQRIEQFSGHRIPLRTTHALQLCDPRHAPLSGRIDLEVALQRVPGLSSRLTHPMIWLEEQSLDPRDLCKALPMAAQAAGVHIETQCQVDHVHADTHSASAQAGQRTFTADCLVACTGAWADYLEPSASMFIPPLSPRKGQMLAVRAPRAVPLAYVLRSSEIYLVPRGDGRIIIGATVEDAGFDRTIDAAASAWLLEKAAALWPPIADAVIEEAWTGLRPGSPDGLPLIGRLSAAPGEHRLWLAAGHYRNGILLAPATARTLADAILLSTSPSVLSAFDPARFAPALTARP